MKAWLNIALGREIRNCSLKIAAFVGTLLLLVNYGDMLLACGLKLDGWKDGKITVQNLVGADLGRKELIKIALTYCVPYCVSTYTSVQSYIRHNNIEVEHCASLAKPHFSKWPYNSRRTRNRSSDFIK